MLFHILIYCFFFFNDPATTEIYTLSLHDALPISGFSVILGGDDRFYNNIFTGTDSIEGVVTGENDSKAGAGTAHFNGYTASLEEYLEKVHQKPGDVEIFINNEQPVYINNNIYLNGAVSFERESNSIVEKQFNPEISIIEEGNDVYLSCKLPEDFEKMLGETQTTKTLKKVRIADADFETPDGSEVMLDTDYSGKKRLEKGVVGPIIDLKKGENRIKVWK